MSEKFLSSYLRRRDSIKPPTTGSSDWQVLKIYNQLIKSTSAQKELNVVLFSNQSIWNFKCRQTDVSSTNHKREDLLLSSPIKQDTTYICM